MIKIIVDKKNDKYEKITLSGHAKYDDYGKDIVCAAASSIFITTVNAIDLLKPHSIKVTSEKDKNIIEVQDLTNETKILLDNMMNMFSELEVSYKKNIKIIK